MTLGDRHLKAARSPLDKVLDIGPTEANRNCKRNRDSRAVGWGGCQEVGKDSSALSRHYKQLVVISLYPS